MRRKFYTILRDNEKSLAIVPENTQIVALQAVGTRMPFFMVDSYPYFIDVVKLLGTDQPIMSLVGIDDTTAAHDYSIAHEAEAHVRSILAQQPRGPYMLGGCSASGIVAYDIAQQLVAMGHEVGLLVLFDTPNPYFMREYSAWRMSLTSYWNDLRRMTLSEYPAWLADKMGRLSARLVSRFRPAPSGANALERFGPLSTRIDAARRYRPAPYGGRFLLIKRSHNLSGRYLDPEFGWGDVVRGPLEVCPVGVDEHLEIFKAELDRVMIAAKLRRCFDQVVESSAGVRWMAEQTRRAG